MRFSSVIRKRVSSATSFGNPARELPKASTNSDAWAKPKDLPPDSKNATHTEWYGPKLDSALYGGQTPSPSSSEVR